MHTNGAGQLVAMTVTTSNIIQNLVLQEDPATFRRLEIQYRISCDYPDLNPFSTHGVQNGGPWYKSAFVATKQPRSDVGYTWDYNGGGYFTLEYSWSFGLLANLSVTFTVSGTMKNAGDNNPVDEHEKGHVTIAVGGSWTCNFK